MHRARALFLVASCAALVSCERLSTDERRVVGTWSFSSMDATAHYIFEPNHRFTIMLPDPDGRDQWHRAFSGTWRVEGNTLVLDQNAEPMPGSTPIPRTVDRIAVREFGQDRIVIGDGGSPFKRLK